MKKYITQSLKYLIINLNLLLFTNISNAQIVNYVPDPSFEDTLVVVGFSVQEALKNWEHLYNQNIIAARAFYFSLTQPFIEIRLPENQWYNQYPRSGSGTVELDNFFTKKQSEFRRSIVKSKLKDTLVKGKLYYAKLYVVPGERTYTSFADGISMYFDNGQLDTMISIQKDSTGIYPQVVPQVINPYGNVIIDTVNWTAIEGCFVANGTESYLTIGNFKNDSATATLVNTASTLIDIDASGMLIDDVCVYAVDMQNWVPDATGTLYDSISIGLPNYQIPDAKWYTLSNQYLGTGSQIKVYASTPQQQYICAIEMCNTVVYDTFMVNAWPLNIDQFTAKNYNLKVYPNPASNTINVSNIYGNTIYVYDAVGALLLTQKVTHNKAVINISNFAKGTYVLRAGNQVAQVVVN
jgi:hypothetical protein